MSIPRLLLVPTHRTGLANAVAAALSEILTVQGHRVRYHHLGPLGPAFSWDRWEGAAFLDPALYDEETLLALYEVATRGAELSLLSCGRGVLDKKEGNRQGADRRDGDHWEGGDWTPAEVAKILDCPVVLVLDCRGWGDGIAALAQGVKFALPEINIVAALLSGVADREHCSLLCGALARAELPVVGCLLEGEGPRWEAVAPGAGGLPLDPLFLDAVTRQVDVGALTEMAAQRGFLPVPARLADRGKEGPLILVAAGAGLTPWSRDSIEVLRAAGARVKRLDLAADEGLPEEVAGLVLAGTLWASSLPDLARNRPLLREMAWKIDSGLPTLAMGGGMLLLLTRVQDSLGRTVEMAGVIPGDGEILWDLEEPAYVQVEAARDNLLLAEGEQVTGWVLTDVDTSNLAAVWDPPLVVRGPGLEGEQAEGLGTESLLCSRVFLHLASTPGLAARFVEACRAYEAAKG